MSLFLDAPQQHQRPPVSPWAVMSLIVAVTGFVNVVGFLAGPVLAYIALLKIRGTEIRGRRLARAALWISYVSLLVGVVTLLVILITAYAALPDPVFFQDNSLDGAVSAPPN